MAKTSNAGGKKASNTSSSSNSSSSSKKKAPAQPTIYVCPYTNQNVYIGKATLKDLKSKSTYANSSRKRLWILPSPQTRNELYVEAAKAIASTEQARLPSFGGRSWEVTCKLTEPHWSGQVLFRAWKGQMELAALPHLLEKIPEPPIWPGRRSQPDEYEEGEEDDDKRLQEREVSSLSTVAWDLRENYPVPNVTLKWQTPERKIFNSRKAAWEHATAMAAREVEINKSILGVGASGKLLKPFIPSAATALKVGKLRFERDGLWVIGQELAWQENRPEELLEEEAAEAERKSANVPKNGLSLYLMSNREEYRQTHEECNTLKQAETELRKIWKTLSKAEQKEWNKTARGDDGVDTEDEADNAGAMEKDESRSPPELEPKPFKPTMTTQAFYIKSRRYEYQEERRASKWSISLSECDIWLRQNWKTLDPTVKEEWKEKHMEFERKLAEEKVEAEREAREAEEAAARKAAEKTASAAQSSEMGGPGSMVMDLVEATSELGIPCLSMEKRETGFIDDAAAAPPCNDAKVGASDDSSTADQAPDDGAAPTPESSAAPDSGEVMKTVDSEMAPNDGAAPTPEDSAAPDSGEVMKTDSEISKDLIYSSVSPDGSESNSANSKDGLVLEATNVKMEVDEAKAEGAVVTESSNITVDSEVLPATTGENGLEQSGALHEEEKKEDDSTVKLLTIPNDNSANNSTTAVVSSATSDPVPSENDIKPEPATVPSFDEPAKKKPRPAAFRSQSAKKQTVPSTQVTSRWCMKHDQIDLCYSACMEHYDTVMRTVKARDLHRELQDGFDVFRERGHGRYDMELPVFEDTKFDFLTSLKKAPWMPVVKSILGEDAILIHKGCFLSMPGSAPQEYHQDGVHLTTQTQRPCHAVNVFVPLVDLNSRNGPTEFCLGSHILGLEDYDRDFVEIPKPKAGTPVIFDYRLGHRGLGNNSSRTCRPIVYCTYARAAQGKEFRDSVNFSRKRYHKIGELSSKPLSREERRNNRKRSLEYREIEELKQALEESTRKSEDGKGNSPGEPPACQGKLEEDLTKNHQGADDSQAMATPDVGGREGPEVFSAKSAEEKMQEENVQLHDEAILMSLSNFETKGENLQTELEAKPKEAGSIENNLGEEGNREV